MKNLFFISILAILTACGGEEPEEDTVETESDVENTDVELIDLNIDPNLHQEFHPNGQLHIEGKHNDSGRRQGLWQAWYDDGTQWSESYYLDGIRDGHSITFYPNGQVRYVGEYNNDERVGLWKFYAEDGTLTNEENF